MVTICPLSRAPYALETCIGWSDREWSAFADYKVEDWEREFARIDNHPVDEVFVAFDGDTPIGMAWMLEQEGVGSHAHLSPWISSVVVDPKHRDQGVAAALLTHIEDYAALGGDDQIYLLTETPAVYFTKGWEVFDTAAAGDDQVFVMQKPISD